MGPVGDVGDQSSDTSGRHHRELVPVWCTGACRFRERIESLPGVLVSESKVQQHPGSTFVGRISRGFDFLG